MGTIKDLVRHAIAQDHTFTGLMNGPGRDYR